MNTSSYSLKQIIDPHEWQTFLLKQEYMLMTQSWNYFNFYKLMDEEAWIFGVYSGDTLVGGAFVTTVHAKRGNFLYIPYGPIAEDNHKVHVLSLLTQQLKKIGKEHNYVCIRISPFWDNNTDNKKLFEELHFQNAPMHTLAETTWILGLSDDSETLLKNMEKNHRNLIKRCEKEGVTIQVSDDIGELQTFQKLHDETAKRHNFVRFPNEYIEKEFSSFNPNHEVLVLSAYLPDGRLDSSAVVYFYGTMAAYRHGASLMQDKRLPTSYALQWCAINEAKKRGLKYYNFWGIAPQGAPKNHPFTGITHFKKGFGGFEKDLLPCQDLGLSWKYYPMQLLEKFRKLKRGFS
ncbi:MAG: peptidoglycan bridge formation glycyltransferase FemA/FemB family protein [Candidatus Magasanikbacteria bacterium]